MPAARFYSSTAGSMNLTADVTDADTSITVDTVAGLPGVRPFTLVLDPGTASEEIVDVVGASGTTLTVTRGVDGSSAQAHAAGVGNVRHMATARDFREPQEHIGASAGVHGVAGAVVGTSDAQTLTNKTLSSPGLVTPVVDSTGPLEIRVPNPAGSAKALTFTDNGNERASIAATGRASLTGVDVTPLLGTATHITVSAPDAQTVDIVQVKKNGATVATVDADGNLTSPTITNLQGADASLDTRLDAVESNLGSQTTFAATSATKDGKRLHWGAVSVDTDASGFATVTHGAGFTPTAVMCQYANASGSLYGDVVVDQITATTFRVRLAGLNGAQPGGSGVTNQPIMFFCGE